ncbi:DDE-type integrase/transposase/recombinase, partial [Kitasatospora sp. NPDC004240]
DVRWCGDITYLPVGGSWMYLATVIDMHSRRVVGWSLAEHMRADLVVDAVRAAVDARGGDVRGVVFHSDRGPALGTRAGRWWHWSLAMPCRGRQGWSGSWSLWRGSGRCGSACGPPRSSRPCRAWRSCAGARATRRAWAWNSARRPRIRPSSPTSTRAGCTVPRPTRPTGPR